MGRFRATGTKRGRESENISEFTHPNISRRALSVLPLDSAREFQGTGRRRPLRSPLLNVVFYIRLIPSGFTRERSASPAAARRRQWHPVARCLPALSRNFKFAVCRVKILPTYGESPHRVLSGRRFPVRPTKSHVSSLGAPRKAEREREVPRVPPPFPIPVHLRCIAEPLFATTRRGLQHFRHVQLRHSHRGRPSRQCTRANSPDTVFRWETRSRRRCVTPTVRKERTALFNFIHFRPSSPRDEAAF